MTSWIAEVKKKIELKYGTVAVCKLKIFLERGVKIIWFRFIHLFTHKYYAAISWITTKGTKIKCVDSKQQGERMEQKLQSNSFIKFQTGKIKKTDQAGKKSQWKELV